ncbi:hypothetical protein CHISP_1920 [Chitinispirillum alkaliphilum]|nr:hypothetical protein CHISP_1920 [Chitinispirillum alkaliphilum]
MQNRGESIKDRIQSQLFWDARLDPSSITVEITDGKIRLSGTVPSYWAKRIAELDTRAVEGVAEVDNEITVELPSGLDTPQDSNITASVQSLLAFDPNIDDSDIQVSVREGQLLLEGSVAALWQKDRAEEAALNVQGIKGFKNRLAVVPTRHYVDELIARDIEAALDRNRKIDVNSIDVQVSEGEVVLNGTVEDSNALKAAEEIAKHTDGVVAVQNNLTT